MAKFLIILNTSNNITNAVIIHILIHNIYMNTFLFLHKRYIVNIIQGCKRAEDFRENLWKCSGSLQS